MFWRGETCYFWRMPHTTIWYVFMWAWWAWTLINSSFHKHDENNSPTTLYVISQQQRGTSIAIFSFQPYCYFSAFELDYPLGIPRRTHLGTFCWIMLWRWKKDRNITFDFEIARGQFQCLSDPKKFVSILWSCHLPYMINPWLHTDHQHECELD
jgi:hypothetical protein